MLQRHSKSTVREAIQVKKVYKLLSFIWVVAVGVFHGSTACGEDGAPSLLEDFFVTEVVYPQDMGEVQVTFSPAYASGDEGEEFTLDVGAELGLTDLLQIEASWSVFKQIDPDKGERLDGSGDFELGLKYSLDECERSGLQVALGFETTFPGGDESVSENAYVYEPFVVISKGFGDDFNLHLHLAYGFVDPEEPHEAQEKEAFFDELEVNFAAVYQVVSDWRLTLEANLQSNEPDDGKETEFYLTPGFLWKGLDDFEMGLAASIGLNNDSEDWLVLGMLSYEFELFEDD